MRVMLVEDSTPMRGIIRQMLGQLGYDDVVEAADGVEAWEQLPQGHFDLLLTDWNMPRMSGLELLQRVRQASQLAYLPVVMLTTRNNKQDIVSAIKAGVNNYVTKPCKPSQLKEKIEKALLQQAERRAKNAGMTERIIQECRKYHPTRKGPYVLFFEAPIDVQAISQGKDRELVRFYSCAVRVLEHINQEYPGLDVGYSIEHETKEVARLVRSDSELVAMLMISGRTSEGFSLARMTGFTQDSDLPMYLLCDSVAALAPDLRDGIARVGVEMLERRALTEVELGSLFENHLIPEVRTTTSGLKFLELVAGEGNLPQERQSVTVHYVAMLQNGMVLDDSNRQGKPYQFTLGKGSVIDGWEEGIAMMRRGGRAILVVPPELAYGEKGDGTLVPPNATLIFNVELLEVGDAPTAQEEQMVNPRKGQFLPCEKPSK